MKDAQELIDKAAKNLIGRRERKQLKKLSKTLSSKTWLKKKKARKVQQASRKTNRGLV